MSVFPETYQAIEWWKPGKLQKLQKLLGSYSICKACTRKKNKGWQGWEINSVSLICWLTASSDSGFPWARKNIHFCTGLWVRVLWVWVWVGFYRLQYILHPCGGFVGRQRVFHGFQPKSPMPQLKMLNGYKNVKVPKLVAKLSPLAVGYEIGYKCNYWCNISKRKKKKWTTVTLSTPTVDKMLPGKRKWILNYKLTSEDNVHEDGGLYTPPPVAHGFQV
jgi:hypothetical protein